MKGNSQIIFQMRRLRREVQSCPGCQWQMKNGNQGSCPLYHVAGHCGKFYHLLCEDGTYLSMWPSVFFQGFRQNGDLWGLRCSIILHVLIGERERRPWVSSVKWGGEKGHKQKEKRTGSSFLARNNACKSRLWGSPCTGTVVKKAGHTGVFPPGNNLQQHCFLIWGIMNNTVDSICSFSQCRTFPRAVSPSDLLIL